MLFQRSVEVESQLLVLAAHGIQVSPELFLGTFGAGHRSAVVELVVAHLSPRLAAGPIRAVSAAFRPGPTNDRASGTPRSPSEFTLAKGAALRLAAASPSSARTCHRRPP